MSFTVRWSEAAEEDVDELGEFRLARAHTVEDFELAIRAMQTIRETAESVLTRTPFTCRKAGSDPLWRELVIPFGATGYVALFEIVPGDNVVWVHAVRSQREQDYH